MANKSKTEIRKAPQGCDNLFFKACEMAKIPITYRQWQKWKQGRGAAHNLNQEMRRGWYMKGEASKP